MISERTFFGGSEWVDLASAPHGSFVLYAGDPRVFIGEGASPATIVLWDARTFKKGRCQFIVYNQGNKTVTFKDFAGNTIGTATANQVAKIWLVDNSTSAGVWLIRGKSAGMGVYSATTDLTYISMGSTASFSSVATTYEYNQQLDTMTTKTASPASSNGSAVFRISGALYHVGGLSGANITNRNIEYNPDVWTTRTVAPDTFQDHAAALFPGGLGYMFGGRSQSAGSTSTTRKRTVEYTFDTWATKTSRPTGRELIKCAAALVNGKIYVNGGVDNTVSTSKNVVDEYYLDTWTEKLARPVPVMAFCATVGLNDEMFSFGGANGNESFPIPYDITQIYDRVTDTWRTATPIFTGGSTDMGVSMVDGKMQVVGGKRVDGGGSATYSARNTQYDPVSDVFTSKAVLPTATSRLLCQVSACSP